MRPPEVGLVQRMLREQFPGWADLPVERLTQNGTDNAMYRIGPDMVARLPLRERLAEVLDKECRWLPHLAPSLPLEVPEPMGRGVPSGGYPFGWAVYRWLPGTDMTAAPAVDPGRLTRDLAAFVSALRRIDPAGGPAPDGHNFHRGVPLPERDTATREAIRALGQAIDASAATAAWEKALLVPRWERRGVWIHGDLDARNLLVRDGRLAGVIDFGGLAVGDPAGDVMVAWKVLPATARGLFRAGCPVDDATWARGRGWALSQAVTTLASHSERDQPTLVREARRWLAEVLADQG